MNTSKYPSSSSLNFSFLYNVRKYNIRGIRGVNPALIDVDGQQMYVYIKNLSPAQLSNDNDDVWRIQLPKRDEFDVIKQSDKMFLLLGYDYINKVYTTWNPYWCKQRLNVAESCSMYSRLSLQKKVFRTQRIERLSLQNDSDVICIPQSLLGLYIKNIKEYYPEESVYIAKNSSIQKRMQEERSQYSDEAEELFSQFLCLFNMEKFRRFLASRGFQKGTVSNYSTRMSFIMEGRFIQNHESLFLECSNLDDYKKAIKVFCNLPDIQVYEEKWHNAIHASLVQYILFVENQLHVKNCNEEEMMPIRESKRISTIKKDAPSFKIDEYGKIVKLDNLIVDKLVPIVKDVDYPDWSDIIKQVKESYPEEITEKMTPLDWMILFENTSWRKKRGRKRKEDNEKITSNNDGYSIDYNRDIQETSYMVAEDVETDAGDPSKGDNSDGNSLEEVPVNINDNKRKIIVKMLNSVFMNTTTSYKYFWFISIISLAKERKELRINTKDILIRMAALAWPIVFEDHINLGDRDMISKYLREIRRSATLNNNSSCKSVENYLTQNYVSHRIGDILNPLLNNVPYRFLSPWIQFTTNRDVAQATQLGSYSGLYSIYPKYIELRKEWWDYIRDNYEKVFNFTKRSFIAYTKLYNPEFQMLRIMTSDWPKI